MKLEYQALTEKVAVVRADLSRTETVYPLSMFAIYAWLFTHEAPVPWLWSLAGAGGPLPVPGSGPRAGRGR